MADHPVLSQRANSLNRLSENTSSQGFHTALHRVPNHVQHVVCFTVLLTVVVYPCVSFFKNYHVAGNNQQETHREYPQPVLMQGQMQNPRHIDVPNYNAVHYHLPPPHVSDTHRDWCYPPNCNDTL